jgi:large subunit ribosomal protein L22
MSKLSKEKKEKVVAKAKYVRTSPRKAGLVMGLIRGKSAEEAQRILKFSGKRVAKPILKTLDSAVSNARQKGFKKGRLKITRAVADPGPSFKRVRFASRGRIARILKRTTHLTIELEESEE